MSDLMRWMYDHYIRPNIESQPKTDGEAMRLDLLKNELSPDMQRTLQEVFAFYAAQGFRLGVRTGAALIKDFN